jgi:hypothetical protein
MARRSAAQFVSLHCPQLNVCPQPHTEWFTGRDLKSVSGGHALAADYLDLRRMWGQIFYQELKDRSGSPSCWSRSACGCTRKSMPSNRKSDTYPHWLRGWPWGAVRPSARGVWMPAPQPGCGGLRLSDSRRLPRSAPKPARFSSAQNLHNSPSPFGHIVGLVYSRRSARAAAKNGGVQMIRLVIDTVLFSCMAGFVTGIVIVAANLLI